MLTSLLVNCRRKEAAPVEPQQLAAKQESQPRITSQLDLERLLVPGMATNEIVLGLGEPGLVENLSSNYQVWHLSVPPFPEEAEWPQPHPSYVVGVTIGITNGHLAYWGAISGEMQTDPLASVEAGSTANQQEIDIPTIQFFLVSKEPIPGGRFIDTVRFPRLGYVAQTPILTIDTLKTSTFGEHSLSDHEGRTNWSFGIFLLEDDAAKLEAITTTNLSKKLLMTIGSEPVSASTVVMPLVEGNLLFECQDRPLMEFVKRELEKMNRRE